MVMAKWRVRILGAIDQKFDLKAFCRQTSRFEITVSD